jgi:hypothetical protein
MACQDISACFKTVFFPLFLLIIVTISLLSLSLDLGLDEGTKKQMAAFVVDTFTAALAWMSQGASNE